MNVNATNTMTPGLKTGDKLVHFEVQQQLASGGMGIVWKGYDHLLGRFVAIKQIADASRMDESLRERFRREAELQKKVSHSAPQIVSIIDFVDDPRGLFIVMEYIDGVSLDRLIAQGVPIEPIRALTIVRDVTLALSSIHGNGVVHRDLKPGNILIPANGGPAKVCDFGQATLLSDQDVAEMGTTQYMAPEMFAGGKVDGRADIYSLGMIAYQMLAGHDGFDTAFKAIVRDEKHQAMRWMKWHTNPRISAPPLNTVNAGVPPVFSDLVSRMMAKDPTQRIGSANDLFEAIRRHFSKSAAAARQQAGPAAAKAPGSSAGSLAASNQGGNFDLVGPATAPLPKKKRWPLVLAVLAILASLGGGGYMVWQNMQKTEERKALQAEADKKFADAMKRYDAEKFADAKPMFVELSDKWGNHPKLGVGSRGYALLCDIREQLREAEQLMVDGNFADATKKHQSIDNLLSEATRLQLPPEAGRLSEAIDKLNNEAETRRSFNKIAGEIAKALAQNDLETAARKQRMLAKTGGARTTAESGVIDMLGAKVSGQQTAAEIDGFDARATNYVNSHKYKEALGEVEKGLKKFPTSAKLQDRQQRINQEMAYSSAMASAEAAEAKSNLPDALKFYQEANKITPDKAINDKIAQIRSALMYQEGQAAEKSNDIAGAAAKYEQANALWPNQAAQDRLKDLKVMGDKNAVLAAADTAATASDYEQAVILYRKALDISPDPQTQAKLNEASVRQAVKGAEGAIARQDLTAARNALNAALAINAEDATAKAMLANLDNVAKFNALVTAGDEARAIFDYVKAKKFYTQAIDLGKAVKIDFAAVKTKLTNTEYDHLISQAKNALELSQIVQARGLLMAAQTMKNTEQVAAMLKEVDDRDPNKKR
jgi:tetratricopeptide (TPR) repeat protein/predicted Ser/Thr protein kinase